MLTCCGFVFYIVVCSFFWLQKYNKNPSTKLLPCKNTPHTQDYRTGRQIKLNAWSSETYVTKPPVLWRSQFGSFFL